jgi:hypothetical protein
MLMLRLRGYSYYLSFARLSQWVSLALVSEGINFNKFITVGPSGEGRPSSVGVYVQHFAACPDIAYVAGTGGHVERKVELTKIRKAREA